jgi:hypothetical protein
VVENGRPRSGPRGALAAWLCLVRRALGGGGVVERGRRRRLAGRAVWEAAGRCGDRAWSGGWLMYAEWELGLKLNGL